MTDLTQQELARLDLCVHRFPTAVVVPNQTGFVLATWCARCAESVFTVFDDSEGEPVIITKENA